MSTRDDAPRIQKLLSGLGYGSRREIERWIRAGRIKVNGQTAQVGDRAVMADKVTIDGRALSLRQKSSQPKRVIAYNKPHGELTTRHDPQDRRTVFDSLPKLKNGRWVAIGRLDINTAGLLLLTTDGQLAHRAMHPSSELTRRYAVRVLGEVQADTLQRLRAGVELDDGFAQATHIEPAGGEGANRWFHMNIKEGRNREVRRLWESQGLTVSRLIRISYGPVQLGRSLGRGRWRALTAGELKALYGSVGLDTPELPPMLKTTRNQHRPKKTRRRSR